MAVPTTSSQKDEFPYKLILQIPFPTSHLASTAHLALRVDAELSPLVRRAFSISASDPHQLIVEYSATTNRMLRVAVNGFFESLGVVVGVMKDLDRDVYEIEGLEGLEGVQGLAPIEKVKGNKEIQVEVEPIKV